MPTPSDYLLGDGSDGNTNINSYTLLNRSMFYHNLWVNATINTAGYQIFCNDTCNFTANAIINFSGNRGVNSASTTGGAGGGALAGTEEGGSQAGANGGTGSITIPSPCSSAVAVAYNGGLGGTGGYGGNGTNLTINYSGASPGVSQGNLKLRRMIKFPMSTYSSNLIVAGLGGQCAGGGGGNGTGQGGGGGGAGSGGGHIVIAARNLIINSGATFMGNGGYGGNGFSPTSKNAGGGGGGAGGGGGSLYLMYTNQFQNGCGITYNNCVFNVSGGLHGIHGNGNNFGLDGTDGNDGSPGYAFIIDINKNTWTNVSNG